MLFSGQRRIACHHRHRRRSGSGADTGTVITSRGADSGAGASTTAADFVRATVLTRRGFAGCGLAAGVSAPCAATTAGPGDTA